MKWFPNWARKPQVILLLTLFIFHIFFMFYNLEKWAPFGWDQVDNAWAAMKIVAMYKYPLLGMVAKGNSGMYIGPLYYYFVALFYFFTHMDPIAAPIIAGITSIFSFAVVYIISKKLFNEPIALVATCIYTCSSFIIITERVQWPVNFIAPISLLVIYFLYRVLTGKTKYFLYLGAAVGLSFHIHFTAIFYPIIILASLPFVRWNKTALKYFIGAIAIGAVFFIPQIIYYVQTTHGHALGSYGTYVAVNYHGFHLKRVIQLIPDAFIKFQSILMTPYTFVHYVNFIFVPIFCLVYIFKQTTRERMLLTYLIALWFLVPWLIFATYSGEISDYYFSLQTYIAVILLAYLSVQIWNSKYVIAKVIIGACWIYWVITNIQSFFNTNPGNLPKDRVAALNASMTSRIIPFTEGDPQSYLYYYYMYHEHKWLPYKL